MSSIEAETLKPVFPDQISSQSITSIRTVGELYRLKLLQAERFRQLARDRSHPDELRIHLRAKACALELCAGDLAQCIAWFGDGDVMNFATEARLNEAAEMTYQSGSPWMRGISVILTELGEVTAAASSPTHSA